MTAALIEMGSIPALQTHPALAKSRSHADMMAHASPSGSKAWRGKGAIRQVPPTKKAKKVAKTSPGEYVNQVRNEGRKVVWPTRKETVTTAIMVLIMTTLLAIFFLGVDALFATIVKYLLGLLG